MRILIAAAILPLLWLPTATAHIAHPAETHRFQLGDADVVIAPVPDPIVEDRPTTFVLVNVGSDNDTDAPTAKLRLTSQTGFDEERTFFDNNSLRETQPILFPKSGAYTGHVWLEDAAPTDNRTFEFSVYRDLPFYFTPLDAVEDPTADRPFRLVFRILDTQTHQPVDAVADLRAIQEPWNAKHAPSQDDVELRQYRRVLEFKQDGRGTWSPNTTFDLDGTWRLELFSESGDFSPNELPPWQVDVLPASKGSGSPTVGGPVLIGVVLVALALVMRAPPRRAR